MSVRELMKAHIHSLNVHLTSEWQDAQTFETLLANCHPYDRQAYAQMRKEELKQFRKGKEDDDSEEG